MKISVALKKSAVSDVLGMTPTGNRLCAKSSDMVAAAVPEKYAPSRK